MLILRKSTRIIKIFLNLEKCRDFQGQIIKTIVNNQEITHKNKQYACLQFGSIDTFSLPGYFWPWRY